MAAEIKLITPPECSIHGAHLIPKVIHYDRRGFLVETLRQDDKDVDGADFHMSYVSMTLPGEARDADRWHHHTRQEDRFVVVLGEMALALHDMREYSPTRGRLEVLRMKGASTAIIERLARTGEKMDEITYVVVVPKGVYHSVKNISQQSFLHVNFPTRLYDPKDEGRTNFVDLPVEELGGKSFSWDLVHCE